MRIRFIEGAAAAIGQGLAGVFAAIRVLRHPRPIHPRGLVLTGEISWLGEAVASSTAPSAGIRWIDHAPASPVAVTARLSRSIGLPAPLPDVLGLALRISTDEGFADVELATTGIGVPGRFLLRPHRTPSRAVFGALFPYRGSRGPVSLCARPVFVKTLPQRMLPADLPGIAEALRTEPWRLRLYVARPNGRWHPFASVTLRTADDQDDRELRFDALRHPLPGAGAYRWERLARQPSYRVAQRDG
jgi:hypothetical protein